MRHFPRSLLLSALTLAIAQSLPAIGADAEFDALSLEAAPATQSQVSRDSKIFIEGSLGTASQRYQTGSQTIGRTSLDITHASRIAPGWRAVISNRLDHIYPVETGADATVNSMREAYLSWQPGGGNTVVEMGRINLRYGPSYGYNPTDFFRDGSLRTLTTANPFALRENRLGTVMLRAQQLWAGGSLSAAYSPKLESRPNPDGWSLDLGSTNNRDRGLIALGTQFSQAVSSQVLLYKESGLSPALGFNLTALLSDAAVAHMEWTRSSEPDLLSRALATPGRPTSRNRLSGGITYTTLGKLSLTAEYQYNGFGLNRAGWNALGVAPSAQLAYLGEALRRQDLAPRQAYLLYATQKSLLLKDLDLTAFLRINAEDQSRLAWVELRHHWPSFDLTFQIQQSQGVPSSEFGIMPDRRVTQVLGTYFF